jgi:hypothetical protein
MLTPMRFVLLVVATVLWALVVALFWPTEVRWWTLGFAAVSCLPDWWRVARRGTVGLS